MKRMTCLKSDLSLKCIQWIYTVVWKCIELLILQFLLLKMIFKKRVRGIFSYYILKGQGFLLQKLLLLFLHRSKQKLPVTQEKKVSIVWELEIYSEEEEKAWFWELKGKEI